MKLSGFYRIRENIFVGDDDIGKKNPISRFVIILMEKAIMVKAEMDIKDRWGTYRIFWIITN